MWSFETYPSAISLMSPDRASEPGIQPGRPWPSSGLPVQVNNFGQSLDEFYEIDDGPFDRRYRYRNLTRDSLRRLFGMVLQDTWLFTGTIRENWHMGESATQEEIEAAAKAAYVDRLCGRCLMGMIQCWMRRLSSPKVEAAFDHCQGFSSGSDSDSR